MENNIFLYIFFRILLRFLKDTDQKKKKKTGNWVLFYLFLFIYFFDLGGKVIKSFRIVKEIHRPLC